MSKYTVTSKTFPIITGKPILFKKKRNQHYNPILKFTQNLNSYLKYCELVILWPNFSATSAHRIFEDAPYKLPFAPNVGPNAKAKTIGFIGKFKSLFRANESSTLTIIAVTGVESTTEDDIAEN